MTWLALAALGAMQGKESRSIPDWQYTPEKRDAAARSEIAYFEFAKSYLLNSPTMSPAAAAQGWIRVVDKASEVLPMPMSPGFHTGPPRRSIAEFETAMVALPRPEAWPEIVKIVRRRPKSRRQQALLMLFARLQGDDREVLRICNALDRPTPASEKGVSNPLRAQLAIIRSSVYERKRDYSGVADMFVRQLESGNAERNVPNLCEVLGNSRTNAWLLHVLQQPNDNLGWPSDRVRRMAKGVMLAHSARIGRPRWDLVEGQDDFDYVDRLVRRFGLRALLTTHPSPKAEQVYVVGLLQRNRVVEAAQVILKSERHSDDLTVYELHFDRRVATTCFWALDRLIGLVPQEDLWAAYSEAAIQSGHAAFALRKISAKEHEPGLQISKRLTLLGYIANLYACLGDLNGVKRTAQRSAAMKRPSDPYDMAGTSLYFVRRALDDQRNQDEQDLTSWRALLAKKQFRAAEAEFKHSIDLQLAEPQTPRLGIGYDKCEYYYRTNQPKQVIATLRDFP